MNNDDHDDDDDDAIGQYFFAKNRNILPFCPV
jgi:hypothetical protein